MLGSAVPAAGGGLVSVAAPHQAKSPSSSKPPNDQVLRPPATRINGRANCQATQRFKTTYREGRRFHLEGWA